MKFFPKKLSLKWINQAYDNNELTPYELVDEILKRAEENKDKNIWIVAPSRELMEKYISKLPPLSERPQGRYYPLSRTVFPTAVYPHFSAEVLRYTFP